MKSDFPVITLLGSNSGNNLGDAAILSSTLEHISQALPDAEFLVPTTKPSFIRSHYEGRYRVRAVNMLPWTGSLRFFGIPTLAALWRSDCALVCDGIIFGKKLWNPAFNFLITLILIAPFAKLFGCKLVCFSTGVGPFPSPSSRTIARWFINSCDLIMMREHESIALCRAIGVTQPIEAVGDIAFLNPVNDDNAALAVMNKEQISPSAPLLGLNVTGYLDSWLSPQEQRGKDQQPLIEAIAAGVRIVRDRLPSAEVVVFSTHPMDEPAVLELARRSGAKVLLNRKYLSHDLQAVMRRARLFVGMRFHSLILASAVGAPVVSLTYAPKVRGFMALLGTQSAELTLKEITPERFAAVVLRNWEDHQQLGAQQQRTIAELKVGAARSVSLLVERIFPERVKSAQAMAV